MGPWRVRREVEFDEGFDDVKGTVRTAHGAVPFSGWIGLLAELQAAHERALRRSPGGRG
jgi:hypothetical protein